MTKSENLFDTWELLVPKVGSGRERERSGVDLLAAQCLLSVHLATKVESLPQLTSTGVLPSYVAGPPSWGHAFSRRSR